MLVLSRKVNERIVIDGNITVVICEVRGDRVRVGVEAPDSVEVHREEVQRLRDAGIARKKTSRLGG